MSNQNYRDNRPQQPHHPPPIHDDKPAAAPKHAEPELDDWTYVLHTGDENDTRDAKTWRDELLKTNPKAAPRLVSEIKLARLTERHVVIALARPEGSNELRAGKPISIKDHWLAEGEDGRVKSDTFCSALALESRPACIKMRRDTLEEDGTIRLGYA